MITRKELDRMAAGGCQSPDCDHKEHGDTFFLHGRCHVGGQIEVSYRAGSGVLRVGCRECGKVIALVAVAE